MTRKIQVSQAISFLLPAIAAFVGCALAPDVAFATTGTVVDTPLNWGATAVQGVGGCVATYGVCMSAGSWSLGEGSLVGKGLKTATGGAAIGGAGAVIDLALPNGSKAFSLADVSGGIDALISLADVSRGIDALSNFVSALSFLSF